MLEKVQERINVNVEPLNEEISNMTKLLQQLINDNSTKSSQTMSFLTSLSLEGTSSDMKPSRENGTRYKRQRL